MRRAVRFRGAHCCPRRTAGRVRARRPRSCPHPVHRRARGRAERRSSSLTSLFLNLRLRGRPRACRRRGRRGGARSCSAAGVSSPTRVRRGRCPRAAGSRGRGVGLVEEDDAGEAAGEGEARVGAQAGEEPVGARGARRRGCPVRNGLERRSRRRRARAPARGSPPARPARNARRGRDRVIDVREGHAVRHSGCAVGLVDGREVAGVAHGIGEAERRRRDMERGGGFVECGTLERGRLGARRGGRGGREDIGGCEGRVEERAGRRRVRAAGVGEDGRLGSARAGPISWRASIHRLQASLLMLAARTEALPAERTVLSHHRDPPRPAEVEREGGGARATHHWILGCCAPFCAVPDMVSV
ncbi:hypothetical protein DMC30DRAFT_217707 [Rhodotorula diobovata]|uniref:Uncharacterized protein n=1 Tax=Rhodotorula diobovata TaxID=5288 RepID=A0A5C5FW47_9BASI|nr:hypothetical protein DMC30DRAFT_217707 [Rhodotorula diobovata]